jgi:hypothetical protein
MSMKKLMLNLVAAASVVGVSFCAYAWNAKDPKEGEKPEKKATEGESKPEKKNANLTAFMRKKLNSAQDIIEGLALEDFEKIEKGARELKASSAAAEFRMIHDKVYADFADDFHRTAAKLEKAATEKRLEGATLAFMDLTMNCVECHKFSRGVLVAK